MKTRFAISLLALVFAVGCSVSKFSPPKMDIPDAYIYSNTKHVSSIQIDTAWWRMFSDTTLNSLVEEALRNNKDIAVAISRVEQARLNAASARVQFVPKVGLDVSASSDYSSGQWSPDYSATATVRWETGLFGRAKNSNDAAQAQYLASQYALQGMRLSLAAQVAQTYFDLLRYRLCMDIATMSYILREQSTAMIDSMFTRGMSSGVDLEQSRSLAFTAAVAIPQYRRALVQSSLSLDILLGRPPTEPVNASLRVDFNLDSINTESHTRVEKADDKLNERVMNISLVDSLLDAIPAGVPSTLLERRPDIAEAYQRAAYSHAVAGLAQAARYPSIILTGQGGVESESLKSIVSGGALAWSYGIELLQPLLEYGTRRRNALSAHENAVQALLQYEKSVVTALSEVESALISISTYREQNGRMRELLKTNFRAKVSTDALYRSGLTNYIGVLDANRSLYSSQILYVNTMCDQFNAYINFVKVLGGGWLSDAP